MTPDELRARIARWDLPHTEFRQAVNGELELAENIVGFANSDGGQLIVGVSKDRTVVGVADVDALLLRVDDVAFHSCTPPVTVIPETVELDGKDVVVLNIPKGDQRPYATRDGRHYIRSGTRCRVASREELLRAFQATHALYFDEQPLPRLGLTELDLDAVSRYLSETGQSDLDDDLVHLLRAWRMYDGTHPTVGGLVLFGRAPQVELQSSHVVVGALAGDDLGGDFLDRKDLAGDLFEIIDQIETFLRLHLRTSHKIVGFEPERHEEIPFAALREAVVNALVHRDYTITGPTRVFVLSDRVEVHSPGRPPNSVDAEAMRAGVHVTRNPHIYSRVAAAQLATRAGTGIRRIARLLRETNGTQLGIDISDAEVTLVLPRGPATPATASGLAARRRSRLALVEKLAVVPCRVGWKPRRRRKGRSMVRWVTRTPFAMALTTILAAGLAAGCGSDTANDTTPSDPTTPNASQPTTTTSSAPVFDPPKAFADDEVRITDDDSALVGPELAYTPQAEGERSTGTEDSDLAIRAIALADGTERWKAQTPVRRHLGLRGHNGFLRLTEGPGPLRLVWTGVHEVAGTGTQQDRFELVVGALDAKTGQHTWSVRMPYPVDGSPEDIEVTVVGANDTHVAIAVPDPADGQATGAVVDVRAGRITASPPGFTPVGLDGQTVVGRRATEGLNNGVAQGIDVATGQPRWTGNTRVDDLNNAVVAPGLAQFVEEQPFEAKTQLVNTADGTVKVTLPARHDCSAAAKDVVVCVSSDQVTALDLTGKPLWTLPDQAAGRIKPTVTAVYSGLVYAEANGGVILDARTGKDLVTDLDWIPDDVVPGYGIDRDDTDGLTSRRATG